MQQQILLSAHGISTDTPEVAGPSSGQVTPVSPVSSPTPTPESEAPFSDDIDNETNHFIASFRNMNIRPDDVNHIGRSSSLTLIRTAIDMKESYVQGSGGSLPSRDHSLKARRPEFWDSRGVSDFDTRKIPD